MLVTVSCSSSSNDLAENRLSRLSCHSASIISSKKSPSNSLLHCSASEVTHKMSTINENSEGLADNYDQVFMDIDDSDSLCRLGAGILPPPPHPPELQDDRSIDKTDHDRSNSILDETEALREALLSQLRNRKQRRRSTNSRTRTSSCLDLIDCKAFDESRREDGELSADSHPETSKLNRSSGKSRNQEPFSYASLSREEINARLSFSSSRKRNGQAMPSEIRSVNKKKKPEITQRSTSSDGEEEIDRPHSFSHRSSSNHRSVRNRRTSSMTSNHRRLVMRLIDESLANDRLRRIDRCIEAVSKRLEDEDRSLRSKERKKKFVSTRLDVEKRNRNRLMDKARRCQHSISEHKWEIMEIERDIEEIHNMQNWLKDELDKLRHERENERKKERRSNEDEDMDSESDVNSDGNLSSSAHLYQPSSPPQDFDSCKSASRVEYVQNWRTVSEYPMAQFANIASPDVNAEKKTGSEVVEGLVFQPLPVDSSSPMFSDSLCVVRRKNSGSPLHQNNCLALSDSDEDLIDDEDDDGRRTVESVRHKHEEMNSLDIDKKVDGTGQDQKSRRFEVVAKLLTTVTQMPSMLTEMEELVHDPLMMFKSYRLCPSSFPYDKIRHRAVSNKIDPFWVLCTYELTGQCKDHACVWQHEWNYLMSDAEILIDIFKHSPSLCPKGLTFHEFAQELLSAEVPLEELVWRLVNMIPASDRVIGDFQSMSVTDEPARSSYDYAVDYSLPSVIMTCQQGQIGILRLS
ncbi:hypothetical protein AB6A40_006029 [Gnathostoma spinigerum]|uniref:Putative zinc-finger domain-containing protein n=1 Tax=Gnathostoma spinigerum TaxID=75299 RepID=A0ABD6EST4_9BILA